MKTGYTGAFTPSVLSAFGTLETNELTPIFQVDFVYGLNVQNWNTAVTSGSGAIVDINAGRLRLQSGTGSTNYAYITSKKIVRYRAGQGNVVRLTPIFTSGVVNNIQLWGVGTLVSNAPIDGYFFGYNGTVFGIFHYPNNTTPNFTPQAAWNGDNATTWDPTKGTPIMIKYPFLGFGDIQFYSQNPATGAWILRHTIQYANTSASIQLGNPSMQVIGYTQNSGNTTNQLMYTGSVGIFLSGSRNYASNPKWAFNTNAANVTTEKSVFSLKNCTSYNGVANRGMIRLNAISIGQTANGVVTVLLRLNATLAGTPTFLAINGTVSDAGTANTLTSANSVASSDIVETYSSGGLILYNISCGAAGGALADLTTMELFLAPGDVLTVTAIASASSTVAVSLNWTEDI